MNTKQKPACIQSEAIAAVAQQGVERALAARKHMVELSSKQAADVGGGLYGLYSPIIAGGIWGSIDIFQPSFEVNSFNINLQQYS